MNISKKSMRDVFLDTLLAEMTKNKNVIFVTADFGSPVLDKIKDAYPERLINVGIAEQNLINVSTGLALEGYTVYAYAIAPFITMRCFEQIRVNLAILSQERPMNVNLVGVGAGCSYVMSGPTHQCLEDISIMRTLPNVEVLSPSDWVLAKSMVNYTINNRGIKYLRFDSNILPNIYSEGVDLSRGFVELLTGKAICIVSTGYMTHGALKVAQDFEKKNINLGVIDIYRLDTMNTSAFIKALMPYQFVISIEEGFINKGGLDSFILHLLNQHNMKPKFKNLGFLDHYNFEIGDREAIHELMGCGSKQLTTQIEKFLS